MWLDIVSMEPAMTQNIYDNATFFEDYSRLPRSVEGLDGTPEWPTLRAARHRCRIMRVPQVHGVFWADVGLGISP
jgi:hypothetical protein